MNTSRNEDWAAQLAAAQAWWREAGVDLAFADKPTDWLAGARDKARPAAAMETAAKPPLSTAAPPPAPRIGGDRAHWPATLADFGAWWLTEPSLDPAPAARRVLPAGPAGTALMVLVATPEPDDREALLSGRQGRLLDAILSAFKTPRPKAYLASALPSPVPLADWAALAAGGLGDVLAHHIALAAPQRLIVFGRDVSPLLGHDPAQAAQSSLRFNHDGLSVPLLYAPSLEALLERPALKRALWRRWLDWTET
jgi:DNA polymerase